MTTNIISFSEDLQKRVREIQATGLNDVASRGRTLNHIQEVLIELKNFTLKYTFLNEQEEIAFFKELKPILMSQYYYAGRMFEISLFDSFADTKKRINYYNRILRKLRRFARKNRAFYEYCLSGATDMDNLYFVRSNNRILDIDLDKKFSTGYDVILAKILANEMIKDFLMAAVTKRESNQAIDHITTLQWTSSKVALVEMNYALHATGTFNHGKTEIKKIVESFEAMFAVDLGNYARIFSEIRIRKSGQANFIDLLKERLLTITDV